jgi:hypothetical protein
MSEEKGWILADMEDKSFNKEEYSKYPYEKQFELFEKALKMPYIRGYMYDMGDIILFDKERHETYIRSFDEFHRIDYLRYLKYKCHPKYFNKENLKYLTIDSLELLYDRYNKEKFQKDIKDYIKHTSFSIMPSMIYLNPDKARKIFKKHLDVFRKLDLTTDEDVEVKMTIFNNLLKFINKNLKDNYIKNGKIDYNNYYDNYYTKINLIIGNLLSVKPIDNKYLSLKYQIV